VLYAISYHLACDDVDNTSLHALDVNSDAVAFAVLTFAYSTETVNGVPGKSVPGSRPLPAPAGPAGTCPGQTDHDLQARGLTHQRYP
jgi:hypothetical protein